MCLLNDNFADSCAKLFTFTILNPVILKVNKLGLKLKVDGKEIPLNEFVEKIMSGTVTGAVTSLRGIKEDWKKIEIEIEK